MQTTPNESFPKKSRQDRKEASHISVSTGVEPHRLERAGSTTATTLHPATRGANSDPLGVGPAKRRLCRHCNSAQPVHEFLLAAHPRAKAESWPIRLWCGTCLVKRGHASQRTLDAVRRRYHEAVRVEQQRARERLLARHLEAEKAKKEASRIVALADELAAQAAEDPAFGVALGRAYRLHRSAAA